MYLDHACTCCNSCIEAMCVSGTREASNPCRSSQGEYTQWKENIVVALDCGPTMQTHTDIKV